MPQFEENMAIVGYIRVSSADQRTDRQLEGIKTDKVFTDKASGKSMDRPALESMKEYIREDDVVLVHSMDRLARSLDDLLDIVKFITNKGSEIHFMKENLIFSGKDGPGAMLMLSIMGAIAQFERSLIRERQMEGIRLAKKRGVYRGKKPSLTSEEVNQIRNQVVAGVPKSKIAKQYGVCRETIYRYLRQTTELTKEMK